MLNVLDSHLGLAVRTKPPQSIFRLVFANICQSFAQSGRHAVRQRHGVISFVRRIPEHDALIARPHIEITLSNMDSTSNVRTLLVDANQNFARLVIKTFAVDAGQVIDVRVKTNALNYTANYLLILETGLSGDFTSNHDHVVLGGGFTSNLALWVGSQARVQNRIADLIAYLVGMAFVHRLGGKQENSLFFRNFRSRGHGGDGE